MRIRDLWANKLYCNETGMLSFFLLGTTPSESTQKRIEIESRLFRDIIQLDFADGYRTLPYKTLSLLHWIKTFCPTVSWVLKSDDDVFVNPFSLNHFLLKIPADDGIDFACFYNENAAVCREGEDCNPKFAVPRSLYSDDYYPPYCEGPAYIINITMALQLYSRANITLLHQFPFEDVYFTGILAQALEPVYYHLDSQLFPSYMSLARKRSRLYSSLFLHLHNSKKASYAMWKNLLHHFKQPLLRKTSSSSAALFESLVNED
ncbi:Beta-1,3-galactosyltransferase 4 [Halocaridina rubra]|uniref:Hexosyltransferase n=1 Tax=Halocaridina rubra TaxID=373956 RepID=A0AAN8X6D7_HALRR